MNKKLFFMPLLAALVLSGCSSDDPVLEDEQGKKFNEGDPSYVAVSIVSPKESNGSYGRAASDFDSNYDEGENTAKRGLFLFFDAKGNATQSPQEVDLEWTGTTNDENAAISNISKAVVVIAGNTKPTQMLVILNYAPDFIPNANGVSLGTLLTKAGPYDLSSDTNGGLLMTNSTWLDGNKIVCATDITGKAFKDVKECDKSENLVKVYVERVPAKITTSAVADMTTFAKGAKPIISGTEVTLSQDIDKLEIANIPTTTYLFKNISNYSDWSDWNAQTECTASWNDPGNFRSYWATSPGVVIYQNQSWNQISDTDKVLTSAQKFYVQENVTGQHEAVVITATLKDKDNNPVTFLRWSGNYYKKEGFLDQYARIVNNAGYALRTEGGGNIGGAKYRNFVADDLRWLTADEHKALFNDRKLKGYEPTACVNEEAVKDLNLVRLTGVDSEGNNQYSSTDESGNALSFTTINNALMEKAHLVWLWEGGKCYYFADIKHHGPKIDGGIDFSTGVVRNHHYALTLQSLQGVGVPVVNPEEEIIPEKPADDLYYLKAQVDILKWRLVNQNVNIDIDYDK